MVRENVHVVNGDWGGLWTESYWQGVTGRPDGLYRPLTLSLIAAQQAVVGDRPWVFHAVSMVLLVLLGWALVAVLRCDGWPVPAALAAALFLCLHPALSEIVNAVVGVGDLLALTGGIAGGWLLCREERPGVLLVAAGLLVLAGLAKESAALFAGAALLTRLWHARSAAAIAAAAGALAAPLLLRVALTGFAGPGAIGFLDNPLAFAEAPARWANGALLGVRYLHLVLWPWPLAGDYSYDALPLVAVGDVHLWMPAWLLGLSLAWWALRLARSSRTGMFGVVLAAGALLLGSHIAVPVGTQFAERLAAPLVAVAAVGLVALLRGLRRRSPVVAAAVVGLWLAAFIGLDRRRTPDWRNDGVLFARAVEVVPTSARAHFGLARWRQGQGDADGALAAYDRALAIFPRYVDALGNRGAALIQRGRHDEALRSYEAAAAARPRHVEAWFAIGALREHLGDATGAATAWRRVLQLAPAHGGARQGLQRIEGD